MNRPVFSIIIPTYNASGTIAECLLSLLGQSFRNFEIIIQDSLSIDDTIEICKSFADDRMKITSKKDSGIYDAMNKGIKLASGEWLYFMGSDDTLTSPDILDKISINLENYDVIYGDVNNMYLKRIYDGEFNDEKIGSQNICHQAIFYKKKVFEIIGEFDTKYSALADWDHNLKWWFSEKINSKYVDVTVANFKEGGFSSQNPDLFFLQMKNWKISVLNRNNLSLLKRIAVFKKELLKALYYGRKRDALVILSELPKLLS